MNPLVSILIPAYNAEKWINDTIKSALCQTWQNKEIIIVNDGSTDGTIRIVKSYESKMVKIISQENQGSCFARNKALEYAQGDYIQWLDADDLLHPDKILKQLLVSECDKNSRELLTSSFGTFYFKANNAKFQPSSLWQDLTPVEWMFAKINDNVWMNPTTWLVSRKLTELAGPWDIAITKSGNDDGEYVCRLVSNSEKVKFVPEAKCYYRIGNIGSLGGAINKSNDKLEPYLMSIVMENKILLSMENSERTRSACVQQLQRAYIFYYPEKYELVKMANDYANNLGGILVPPVLKWRYKLIQKAFGWRIAKRARFVLPKWRILFLKSFNKLLMDISNS